MMNKLDPARILVATARGSTRVFTRVNKICVEQHQNDVINS